METKFRTVADIVPSLRTTEGGGIEIRRVFPTSRLDLVDPFLLFDHLGPKQVAPGVADGFPAHPHRGFETVTYLLDGAIEHRDSFGNRGRIGPGDVQWMTAGSGLVHSEMPAEDFVRTGGTLHGFQIWVNLPRRDKMAGPHYQDLEASRIPAVERDGVRARIIAGEALGRDGIVSTHTPILYVHFTLAPGASVEQAVPRSRNGIAYVVSGEARFTESARTATAGQMAVFLHDGEAVQVSNASRTEPLEMLLLAGEPLGEPVARYGPFVMNTKEEIVQAFEDFRAGRMGVLAAEGTSAR